MAAYEIQDISYADRAPVIAEGVGVVRGTPQEVWDAILDYPGWTRWFASLTSCEATSDPATGVGSTRDVGIKGGVTVSERFIVWDEPTTWGFTVTDGPPVLRSLVERITIRPLDDERTQVTYRMALGPKAWFLPMVKLARPQLRKNLEGALRGLDAEVARRRTA